MALVSLCWKDETITGSDIMKIWKSVPFQKEISSPEINSINKFKAIMSLNYQLELPSPQSEYVLDKNTKNCTTSKNYPKSKTLSEFETFDVD